MTNEHNLTQELETVEAENRALQKDRLALEQELIAPVVKLAEIIEQSSAYYTDQINRGLVEPEGNVVNVEINRAETAFDKTEIKITFRNFSNDTLIPDTKKDVIITTTSDGHIMMSISAQSVTNRASAPDDEKVVIYPTQTEQLDVEKACNKLFTLSSQNGHEFHFDVKQNVRKHLANVGGQSNSATMNRAKKAQSLLRK
ncbi:MAG: hypothetical protein CMP22_04275 [Rickettsiales bacterium]|nr:hypothetical protein [Rickettsiales bacterium]